MEKLATEIYAFSAEKRTIVEELVEEIPGVRYRLTTSD